MQCRLLSRSCVAAFLHSCIDGWSSVSALVSRRSVNGRNRDIVEAQVHAQLTTMMNDVAEHEASERGDAGHREHFLPAPLQRPASQVLRVALVHPRARASGVVVEGAEDFGA